MKKLIVVSDKTEFGMWARIGRKVLRSRYYSIEDPKVFNSFISVEQPELIYFDLNRKYESEDLNDLLLGIKSFPLNALILEASPVKIDLYSLLVPSKLFKKIFHSRRYSNSYLTFSGH